MEYKPHCTLAHLRCDEIPKTKGKQEQQNSDPIASQMFSFVLVDMHVVKVSGTVQNDESTADRRSRNLAHTQESISLLIKCATTWAPDLLVTKSGLRSTLLYS